MLLTVIRLAGSSAPYAFPGPMLSFTPTCAINSFLARHRPPSIRIHAFLSFWIEWWRDPAQFALRFQSDS